jgi:hypothetical protein
MIYDLFRKGEIPNRAVPSSLEFDYWDLVFSVALHKKNPKTVLC